VGLGSNDDGYVLADMSMRGTPEEWARIAVNAYHHWKADRIVAETNNGGEMVEAVIRMADRNTAFKAVHASRGKMVRAEPVSALYEQGRCHHVGAFPVLEDQMCDYDPKTAKFSPDRMDALVWAATELLIDTGGTATQTKIIGF
jgi:phage terminase large subunit-like protein